MEQDVNTDMKQPVLALEGTSRLLFEALHEGSRDPASGGVTRDAYGAGEQFAHALMAEHARKIGLEVRQDDACNLYMVWPGRDRALPAVVIGSHLDSVPAGGNFDGAAGVVSGLVAVQALKDAGYRPECDIVVMGVRAEESAWFHVSYTGSRAALGRFKATELQARRFDTGKTLADHIRACGGDPDAIAAGKAVFTPDNVRAFMEVHIEQAPSMAQARVPVAIGTGIPGNVRYPQVTIRGEYAHVGLPRRFRHDAALAGADFATAMDRLWAEWDAAGRGMAYTIGEFYTDAGNHGMTKVAGEFRFSLDVRAYEERDVAELEAFVLRTVGAIEAQRGVRFDLGRRTTAEVAKADPVIFAQLEQIAGSLEIATIRLPSPASHDAAAFCAAGIPFGLVFIRNPNGSHHPDEAMDIRDFSLATAVLAQWLKQQVCGEAAR